MPVFISSTDIHIPGGTVKPDPYPHTKRLDEKGIFPVAYSCSPKPHSLSQAPPGEDCQHCGSLEFRNTCPETVSLFALARTDPVPMVDRRAVRTSLFSTYRLASRHH